MAFLGITRKVRKYPYPKEGRTISRRGFLEIQFERLLIKESGYRVTDEDSLGLEGYKNYIYNIDPRSAAETNYSIRKETISCPIIVTFNSFGEVKISGELLGQTFLAKTAVPGVLNPEDINASKAAQHAMYSTRIVETPFTTAIGYAVDKLLVHFYGTKYLNGRFIISRLNIDDIVRLEDHLFSSQKVESYTGFSKPSLQYMRIDISSSLREAIDDVLFPSKDFEKIVILSNWFAVIKEWFALMFGNMKLPKESFTLKNPQPITLNTEQYECNEFELSEL